LNAGGLYGMPLVVSEAAARVRANGPVSFLYELTMVLSTDWREVADCYARKLGLQRDKAVDITFARFGYEGTLLMFAPDRLDRIELAEAHDPAFAMGRFSGKRGDALYMCYIETHDLADVIRRLESRNAKWTRRTDTGKPEQDGLWIHPSALNGVLLGVSRTSLAWGWSGSPRKSKRFQRCSRDAGDLRSAIHRGIVAPCFWHTAHRRRGPEYWPGIGPNSSRYRGGRRSRLGCRAERIGQLVRNIRVGQMRNS
jgi:hypothetical protein